MKAKTITITLNESDLKRLADGEVLTQNTPGRRLYNLRQAFLLALLNSHNATSNYGGTIGRITMKITNDYE